MGKATHVRLQRSEGGDDRGVLWGRHHNCRDAAAMRRALNDPDVDLIMFPVGLAGFEMPSEVPFEVKSGHACRVCGALTRIWATWSAPQTFALWTP